MQLRSIVGTYRQQAVEVTSESPSEHVVDDAWYNRNFLNKKLTNEMSATPSTTKNE